MVVQTFMKLSQIVRKAWADRSGCIGDCQGATRLPLWVLAFMTNKLPDRGLENRE
jgi:hypothetical protein